MTRNVFKWGLNGNGFLNGFTIENTAVKWYHLKTIEKHLKTDF